MIQSDDDVEATHLQLKLTISEWGYLIRITRVCLEPYKSVCYIVDYEWIKRKWKCTNPGQDTFLEATNKTRKIVPLQYLKENRAMFVLGMYLAPDGNNKDQVK